MIIMKAVISLIKHCAASTWNSLNIFSKLFMTDQQKQALQALSQDLYRVAMGRHRGQTAMAAVFTKQAIARLSELENFPLAEPISASLASSAERSAEDLLMYSTFVQNQALT